jgi:glycosyltransferase involved in cell wall biosynthesis
MRILLVIDGMHPRDGGPPAVVSGSSIALQPRGARVQVLTILRPGDEADVRATWRRMTDSGVELSFCAPVGLGQLLGASQSDPAMQAAIDAADVVHLHGFWTPALILAARMARKAGKPYFISTHGLLDHRAMRSSPLKFAKKRLALQLFDLRSIFERASGVIFGSETEAGESWQPAPAMRKLFIPNGVDARVGRETAVSAEARARLVAVAPQFAQWQRSLLFFSRIHPKKGVDMLVRAFNAVSADYPGAGLLIAGLAEDTQYEAEVARLIAACPIPDNIVLTTKLTGPGSHFLYSTCDIFVLPSHAEGFSVALTEALAHGRPSLITRYCHVPAVESEGAGLVVDPDPASIEAGLRKLLSLSDDALAAMGRNARLLFERHYTWDRVAEQLEAAYSAAGARTVPRR